MIQNTLHPAGSSRIASCWCCWRWLARSIWESPERFKSRHFLLRGLNWYIVYDGLLCENVKKALDNDAACFKCIRFNRWFFVLPSHRRRVFPASLKTFVEARITPSVSERGKNTLKGPMRAPGHIQRCYCLLLYTSKDIQVASITALPSQKNQSPPNIPTIPITYKIFKGMNHQITNKQIAAWVHLSQGFYLDNTNLGFP